MKLVEEREKINRGKKRVELLSPAGNREAFIAAVESGADAIYCGGPGFNARMGAGNFSDEEMAEAIAFAHKRGVRVHVTVNTLISDEELPSALEYCEKLYAMGADALIIQDLGLAYLIHKSLPDMELHLSTQGTIHDPEGVKAAAKLGFSRVVLARELSLDEIREIAASSPIEVETFCHGAICICYSGQCQLSRYIGGRSANRGACAQPCRLPYLAFDEKGRSLPGEYPLSPADLSYIDHLGELIEAGVSSFKIEGRMKSPEYVATVTSIYRKYMDEYMEKGEYRVSGEDRLALYQIFNRGFTDHHLEGREDENFLSGDLPKNRGVRLGRVVKEGPGKNLVEAELDPPPEMGDLIEVRGRRSTASARVTYIKKLKGSRFIIGDVKEKVAGGDGIYRISSASQIKEASKSYKEKDWHQGKYERKLSMTVEVKEAGGFIEARGRVVPSPGEASKEAVVTVGPFGESEGSVRDRVRTALDKTGGTPFCLADLKVDGDIRLSASMAELNSLRRKLLVKLEAALEGRRKAVSIDWEKELADLASSREEDREGNSLELYFYSLKDYRNFRPMNEMVELCRRSGRKLRVLLPLEELREGEDIPSEGEIEIIPYLDGIVKGEAAEEILRQRKPSSIYIGNIGWIEGVRAAGSKPLYDYGMNVYNAGAIEAMRFLGAEKGMPSLETEGIYSGAIPLMTMEHIPEAESLVDRKGSEYLVLKRGKLHRTVLLPLKEVDYSAAVKNCGEGRIRIFVQPEKEKEKK